MPRSYQRMLRDLMNLDIDDRPPRRHNPHQPSSSSGTYGSTIYPEDSRSNHRRNTYYSSHHDPYSPDPRRYGGRPTARPGQQEWTNVFSSHHRPHRIITRDVYRSYDPFDYNPYDRPHGSMGPSVQPRRQSRMQGSVSPGWPRGPPIPQVSRDSQHTSHRSGGEGYRDRYSDSGVVYPDSSSETERTHNLSGRNRNRDRDRGGYGFRETSGQSGERSGRDIPRVRVFREVPNSNGRTGRSGGGGFMGNWFGGRSGWR